jgi:hypothetical protein
MPEQQQAAPPRPPEIREHITDWQPEEPLRFHSALAFWIVQVVETLPTPAPDNTPTPFSRLGPKNQIPTSPVVMLRQRMSE